jgi:hypothetical protein
MKAKTERNAAVATLYRAGFLIEDIAFEFGISPARVEKIARVAGCPRRFERLSPTAIEIRPTVRETAVANIGKAHASQIAEAVGTTRDAIIGHWYRHRQTSRVAS